MNAVRPLLTALALTTSVACSKPNNAVPPPPASTAQPVAAASQPAAAASQPAAAAADAFSGEVRLADGVSADLLKPTDVLYLMARECATPDDCTKPGRLVAVQQHKSPTLPMKFSVGPESVMMAGTPFVGPFLVQARIDRDGDAMTKGADDLYAEVTSGVKPGQSGVMLAVAPPPK